ncbi:type II secretory pathway, component ExeA [Longilinea arvoryzae]|uniref:Type II secretory pathway, component ExeA n=1 Tax=Longilinea arvoryzae TaxID=360412 RepID=A0A0K8MXV1_9CHLR|nr:AAA family ATPase [Longilinea arvoryzae]GAP16084.1 type II secretory pathway, component ExeA [Longilinea arvoryzae]
MFNTASDEEWKVARLDRLGLKEDPFKLSADPRFLFLGPEHLAVYRQAQGVISRRRGLALISGDMGMGKSSLARRLYDVYAAEENVLICYIHTAAFKSAMDAARQISMALNVPPQRSFQRQMEGLERLMADAYTAHRNVIILLDDAQLMDPDALEVIHRLYNFDYDAKVAQVIAFGQLEMSAVFETNKAVNARVFVRLALPPLTLSSSLQMVLFRLRVAGRNSPLIDDDAFEMLYEASQGVPREMIRLCALATDLLLASDATAINIDIAREVSKQ